MDATREVIAGFQLPEEGLVSSTRPCQDEPAEQSALQLTTTTTSVTKSEDSVPEDTELRSDETTENQEGEEATDVEEESEVPSPEETHRPTTRRRRKARNRLAKRNLPLDAGEVIAAISGTEDFLKLEAAAPGIAKTIMNIKPDDWIPFVRHKFVFFLTND